MSCIVLPSLKLRMVVASVARLFEEVICRDCLCARHVRRTCDSGLSAAAVRLVCASDLGFVPVFRLNTQRVWRVVVEWSLRLIGFPRVWVWFRPRGSMGLAIWLQCTAHRRVAFR